MNLFTKKSKENTEEPEEYSALFFPFADENFEGDDKTDSEKEFSLPESIPVQKLNTEPEEVKVYPGGISPLDSLRQKLRQTTAEISEEIVPEEAPVINEPVQEVCEEAIEEVVEEKEISKQEVVSDFETPKEEPKVSLLDRCMPYIYDEEGVSQIDTKPDYVLESVEDIIKSAEAKADKKIAELYKLTETAAAKDEEKEIPMESRTATVSTPKTEVQRVSLPKTADILFDDFTSKRTVVTEDGNSSVTETYSQLTDLQAGIPSLDLDKTRVMPSLNQSQTQSMEDILSHTKQVNIKDAPAIKAAKPITVTLKHEEPIVEVEDDYRCPDDTKRIGTRLKKERRNAFLRFYSTLFFTLISAVVTLILPEDIYGNLIFLPCLIQTVLLGICSFVNINIFASFKAMFTKKANAASPVALCVSGMIIYMLYGLIFGVYPFEPVLLSLVSLCVYDLFALKRSTSVLNNFRIIVSGSEKKAVALIDDQSTASSMARSSISGEVLAAGVKRTGTVTDFLLHTACDTPFANHLSTVTIVFLALAVVFAAVIGISHSSFNSALCAGVTVLSIFAMPTYSFSEFFPLDDLSKRLYRLGAMVCGKFSASRIEQANAVVVTSAELFPEGSIELFNINPLGSNNIDATLTAAAAVARAIDSPLVSVFNTFVDSSENLPSTDSVKYEDNLGISGWVGDDHYFIGNRTLMEAHGIRVPALEVDRKILHRGFFPIYVACNQRACALMVVRYRINRKVRSELVKMINAGITLLIDNCDSNITVQMLSDYYDLYPDSIKIMDHKGVHNYKNAVNYSESYSSHAAHIGSSFAFFSIINGCLKLRFLSNLICSAHIVLASLFCVIYALAGLDGTLTLLHISACLIIELICLALSAIIYYIGRR